jgi:hypothetical protein
MHRHKYLGLTYLFPEFGERLPSEVVLRNCGSCMVGGLWLLVLFELRCGVAEANEPPDGAMVV